ncbi:putative phosphatidate phosphatase isoform X1 [Tribolium castaneum]|uniref:Phosphatidate phosphatase-like Protein n=1 Tax=Tribolium castaneum TaxID=7070 RepID=D2A465_TRICA|nr:PREDICTED: putative phosphatidate phosphatase isoform X1 [Tribolium castaneum]EFA05622.1 Putative phosphatidate phosphatase-like Protein [Tribolium castaneum]|eukprot:XP_008195026.1 PREDICTED: putative phosphatidate phosphatase isoform X1 [Tribolium castaneum]
MDSPPTLSLTQICTDSLILAIVGFPILLIRKSGKIHERGFFCNDVTITHPIPEVSTINNKYFHLVGNLLTIFIIISVELSIIKRQEKVKLWRLWCYNIYQILTCFTLGLLATILITTIFKGSIGRLRPYFFNSCLPNVNCSLPQNHHVYHTIFTCTNKNYKKNSRLSFPSGHSSYAMFCGLFLAIYLHKRAKKFKLGTSLLQIALFGLVFYIGCTRIFEYHHHWSDVIAGFLVGLICAIFVSLNLYKTLDLETSLQDT